MNGVGTTEIGYGSNNGYKGQVFIVSDSLSWVKGKHSFKFGGEYRHMDNRGWTSTGALNFDFNPETTGLTGQPWSKQVGFGFASFLLGEVNDAIQGTAGDLHGRRSYVALFAQDDWRVNDKLTLNYGLRWEHDRPVDGEGRSLGELRHLARQPHHQIPGALAVRRGRQHDLRGASRLVAVRPAPRPHLLAHAEARRARGVRDLLPAHRDGLLVRRPLQLRAGLPLDQQGLRDRWRQARLQLGRRLPGRRDPRRQGPQLHPVGHGVA